MFAARFFGHRYFGIRYFGGEGDDITSSGGNINRLLLLGVGY